MNTRPSSTSSNTTSRPGWRRPAPRPAWSTSAGATASPASSTRPDGALLAIETPAGPYALEADWLLACDGARSTIRARARPDLPRARPITDRFLIADVTMRAPASPPSAASGSTRPSTPASPCCCTSSPTTSGGSTSSSAPRASRRGTGGSAAPARVRARVAGMLGPDVPFTVDWISLYSFRCRRLERFRHGRCVFLGDAAHQVSPFGARGGNGGVQDADNLGWKLGGHAGRARRPRRCSTATTAERIPAADEDIRQSSRSTDFISPKNPACRAWRDAVLELAAEPRLRPPAGQFRPAVAPRDPGRQPAVDARCRALGGRHPLGGAAVDAPVTRAGKAGLAAPPPAGRTLSAGLRRARRPGGRGPAGAPPGGTGAGRRGRDGTRSGTKSGLAAAR